MAKKITEFRNNLRTMSIGEELEYAYSSHNKYKVTASTLKKKGEGVWECAKRTVILVDDKGIKRKVVYYSAIRKS